MFTPDTPEDDAQPLALCVTLAAYSPWRRRLGSEAARARQPAGHRPRRRSGTRQNPRAACRSCAAARATSNGSATRSTPQGVLNAPGPRAPVRHALHGMRDALDAEWDSAKSEAFKASRYVAEIAASSAYRSHRSPSARGSVLTNREKPSTVSLRNLLSPRVAPLAFGSGLGAHEQRETFHGFPP